MDKLKMVRNTTGSDYNLLFERFVGERFLYRLTQSKYSKEFVLKGATLIVNWTDELFRPTRDVDLLGYDVPTIEKLEGIFHEISEIEIEPDGVIFDTSSLKVIKINDDQDYGGVRLNMQAKVGSALIPLQVDVGYGDIITPSTQPLTLHLIPSLPTTVISSYPIETVIAEKLDAIVTLGIGNSRMKDFYDLWFISNELIVDMDVLKMAVEATFRNRKTELPTEWPLGLTSMFSTDRMKLLQWKAFLDTHGFAGPKEELVEVVNRLREFYGPVLGIGYAKQ